MSGSNRFVLVDREIISGMIEGVDFGPRLYCVARSPSAVLVWVYGHSWSVNGYQRYAEPHFIGLPDRSGRQNLSMIYKRIGTEGGRLSHARAWACRDDFAKLFGEVEVRSPIADAVRLGKTLLVDGGGPRLAPAQSLGREAYDDWKRQSERGFVNVGL